ncbi:MAG TPA: biotin--[acetyl-CoA-carboxylase] ligase [Opitutaceae bacterium]|nr:biotin--[acetyl-CoA-carboxylase] ligase [Opitutaceae bacterium]
MSGSVQLPPSAIASATDAEGWTLRELDEVDSTNRHAAALPPWTAVTARTQSAGRGRHDRHWVSDTGGLWLSAVVPATGPAERWSLLPLAAGLALCEAFTALGLAGHRLRWPNDIMVGRAKLAGILVERFRPDTAVVGLGINYANRPEAAAPELAGSVARLTDLLAVPPALPALRDTVLSALRRAHGLLAAHDSAALVTALMPYWRRLPVDVTLRPDGEKCSGTFVGVDPDGRLLLQSPVGLRSLAPHEVELLREDLPPDTDLT